MRRLATALLVGLLTLPVATASAQKTTTTLMSSGAIGDRDPLNEYFDLLTGEWQPAYVVEANSAYLTIEGTRWISVSPSSQGPPASLYRASFSLPKGFTSPSLVGQIFVDDQATVSLNRSLIGGHRGFNGDPGNFAAAGGEFLPGQNVLEFVVVDEGNPTALNYKATLSYSEAASPTPPPSARDGSESTGPAPAPQSRPSARDGATVLPVAPAGAGSTVLPVAPPAVPVAGRPTFVG